MTEQKTTFREGVAHGSPTLPVNQEKFPVERAVEVERVTPRSIWDEPL